MLMDGSPARPAPVELENVDTPTVLTAVVVEDVVDVQAGSPAERCLRGPFADSVAAGPVVTRVGANSETVTFRISSGRGLAGCDDSPGARAEDRRWCGIAVGAVPSRRLRDPRLDIGCVTSDGDAIGFVWVEPGARASYVVVSERGYAEVYEVAERVPVRVASTRDVDTTRTRASFDVSEHDRDGRLLQSYRLEAYVAG
jgi:hypothetical protein